LPWLTDWLKHASLRLLPGLFSHEKNNSGNSSINPNRPLLIFFIIHDKNLYSSRHSRLGENDDIFGLMKSGLEVGRASPRRGEAIP
jgi:hypothetical protein